MKSGKKEGKKAITGKGVKGISFLEMSMLIVSLFAFCYLISPEIVSAQATQCCGQDINGTVCMDYSLSECNSKCASSCLPTSCSNSADCKIGCCFDSVNGLCSANSPKGKCIQQGGIWKDTETCNINTATECRLGCCILGGSSEFITQRACEKRASEMNLRIDFRNINSEIECLALGMAQEKGACVLNEGGCKFITNAECRRLTGRNIFSGALCTADFLNTSCRKTSETMCVDRKDEVYFKDSCGNPANIYDSSKINDNDYWKNIARPGNSCGALNIDGNKESKNCGNCFRYLGTGCEDYRKAGAGKPDYGENICRDLNCKDAPLVVDAFGKVLDKKNRKNGESWCVYDSKIGEGDDVVGARHYRYSCSDGKVIVEPCADFRNQICVEQSSNSSIQFSSAVCRTNNWRRCIDLDFGGNGKISENDSASCEEQPDCLLKKITFADSFNFNTCIPENPAGFGSEENWQASASQICGLASKTCVIKYKSKPMGGCECVDNCACDEAVFTQEMNDLCRKLGDCGLEANVNGKYTQNFAVSGAPGLSSGIISTIVSLVIPRKGNKADVQLDKVVRVSGGNIPDVSQDKGVSGTYVASAVNEVYSAIGVSSDSGSVAGTGGVITGMQVAGGLNTPYYVGYRTAEGFVEYIVPGPAIAELGAEAVRIGFTPLDSGAAQIISSKLIAPPASTGTPIVEMTMNPIAGETSWAGTQAGLEFGKVGGGTGTGGEIISTPPSLTPSLAGIFNFAMTAMFIVGTATLITSLLGRPVDMAGMLAGGAAGIAAGLAATFIPSIVGGAAAPTSILVGGSVGLQFTTAYLDGIGMIWIPNPPMMIAIAVAVIVMMIMGGGILGKKCPPKMVTFTCSPWKAPDGGQDCSKCNAGGNDDKLKTCSKYKCESLGKACKFVNEGTNEERCVALANDGNAPRIYPNLDLIKSNSSSSIFNYTYSNITDNGAGIKQNDGRCIEEFTPIVFGITTDEVSECKFSLRSSRNWDEMTNDLITSSLMLENHSVAFMAPSIELLTYCSGNESYSEMLARQYENFRIYARCKDSFGNYNLNEYIINTCVRAGKDNTPPLISGTLPANNANIPAISSSINLALITNEPAECRYSETDKAYSEMENTFSCIKECEEFVNGWGCNATLQDISKGENKMFIRCKDKPWLNEDSEERNVNIQGYEYKFRLTETPLNITSKKPSGKVFTGNEPAAVSLELETSGGIENGKSACFYNWLGNWILFFETGASSHRQRGMNLLSGSYSIPVRCVDSAGNIAEDNAEFSVEVDDFAPIITRVYDYGGTLKLFTDENSECAYSNVHENCGFIFENGTRLSGGFNLEHSMPWDIGKEYYIKCRDAFNHEPSGCSIKIRAYQEI